MRYRDFAPSNGPCYKVIERFHLAWTLRDYKTVAYTGTVYAI
jgi:hypothetical protein